MMHRMPESTARLVFPLADDFLGVALDSTRFYLRRYRVGRQPAGWVRQVLEEALAAPVKASGTNPLARLELKAGKSTLRLTLRLPLRGRAAPLRALLRRPHPGTAGTLRSLDHESLVILTVPIPGDR